MFISWHDIGQWAIGVLGTTVGNLITLAIVGSITQTKWFKILIAKLTDDFNNIVKQQRLKDMQFEPKEEKK